ncbi:MAG TPA: polysaccharide deacetylase family protein [Ferruginibacter sp.]|nr:polysaccharide deacetylase family protein [Ferruginibacter sp.]
MPKRIVLNFHNEHNAALFEKIIVALKSRYQLVSIQQLEQLMSQKIKSGNICHITFDDGERSFYEVAFPVLKKHNIPVSLFLSPFIISSNQNFWFQEIKGYDPVIMKDIIAKQLQVALEKISPYAYVDILKTLTYAEISKIINAYQQQTRSEKKASMNMSLNEVLEVERSGLVTIGAHTLTHPILKNEDDNNSDAEITKAIKELEALLHHPVKYFAYPNGRPGIDFGEREMACLKKNGITMAFSTELNYVAAGTNMLSVPRMGFPRMGLSPSNPLIYFRLALGKKWIDIKSISKPSEKKIREKINSVLGRIRV